MWGTLARVGVWGDITGGVLVGKRGLRTGASLLGCVGSCAVVSLGESQVWKGTFTPRWPKVTPKEGDRRQHPLNTHQVTMKCAGSWQQEKQWGCPAARLALALLAPVPLCQPEGNPCQHHWGPAWPHSRSVTQGTSP